MENSMATMSLDLYTQMVKEGMRLEFALENYKNDWAEKMDKLFKVASETSGSKYSSITLGDLEKIFGVKLTKDEEEK